MDGSIESILTITSKTRHVYFINTTISKKAFEAFFNNHPNVKHLENLVYVIYKRPGLDDIMIIDRNSSQIIVTDNIVLILRHKL